MPEAPRKVSPAQVMDVLRALSQESHRVAVARGFYKGSISVAEQLMFVVKDLAGCVAFVRRGRRLTEIDTDATGKPRGFPVKLADAAIRIFDLAGFVGFDLGAAVELKMKWNSRKVPRE